MKKYIEPKMECRKFLKEHILTESGATGSVKSSTERVVDELTAQGISSDSIFYAAF